MLHKSLSFQIKSIGESEGVATFEGYAAIFNNIDRSGDILLPGAFKNTLAQFLKEGVILSQHRSTALIGRPLEAHEDAKGLWLKAEILLAVEAGREAYELMKAGILKKMSIGYEIDDYERLTDKNIEQYAPDATVTEIARALDWWGLALKEVTLYEVSPVSIPANPLADITAVKNVEGLRFDEHLISVLGAVKGLKARAADIAGKRAADGRQVSEKSRAQLSELCEALAATSSELKTALEAKATPTDQGEEIDGAQLKARIEKRRESLAAIGITL